MLRWKATHFLQKFTCSIYRPTNHVTDILKTFSSLSSMPCFGVEIKFQPKLEQLIPEFILSNRISTSTTLMSAPIKKKRKVNTTMADRSKDERKRKRIVKALRKMDKKPRIPKPLTELEVHPDIFGGEMKIKRERILPILSTTDAEEKTEQHQLIMKEWSRFAGRRHADEIQQVDRVLISRKKALAELRKESYELYAEALKPDISILDQNGEVLYQASGPTSTPPIREVSTMNGLSEDWLVDGYYEEVTKKFSVQYADTKAFMNKLIQNQSNRRRKKAETEE